jgi:hypothetical protein
MMARKLNLHTFKTFVKVGGFYEDVFIYEGYSFSNARRYWNECLVLEYHSSYLHNKEDLT